MKIRFSTDGIDFDAELNATKTAAAIGGGLPLEGEVCIWGDEVYFDIGLKALPENPTTKVTVGDIAYWPQGRSVCIFFGPTPISTDGKPRPASPVTIVGSTTCPAETLRKIQNNRKIRVEKR